MKEYISSESMRSQLFAGDAIIVRKNNDGTLWHHKFIKDEFDLLYQLKK
jgi:signal peptidase I